MDDATTLTLMGVEAAYLTDAFAAIVERYGSVERYADEVLGVDAARRQALATRLVD